MPKTTDPRYTELTTELDNIIRDTGRLATDAPAAALEALYQRAANARRELDTYPTKTAGDAQLCAYTITSELSAIRAELAGGARA